MAVFPNPSNTPGAPEPRVGSSDKKSINITKNSFEGNYLQVRRTSTRSRKAFQLKYNNITLAEFAILEAFFDINVGTVFTFTHPVELVSYQVTFKEGTLEKTYTSFGIVDTNIELESV